jgi:hypothetical protein
MPQVTTMARLFAVYHWGVIPQAIGHRILLRNHILLVGRQITRQLQLEVCVDFKAGEKSHERDCILRDCLPWQPS